MRMRMQGRPAPKRRPLRSVYYGFFPRDVEGEATVKMRIAAVRRGALGNDRGASSPHGSCACREPSVQVRETLRGRPMSAFNANSCLRAAFAAARRRPAVIGP